MTEGWNMTSAAGAGFPFYGREDEQLRLRGLFDQMRDTPRDCDQGWSNIAVIHGLGGIGKSTLLARAASWLRGEHAEPAYGDRFTVLHIDWERERGLARAAFPAGSGPSPDTVLGVLRRAVVEQLGDKHFRHYDELGDRQLKALSKLEASTGPQVGSNAGGGESGARALPVLRAALAVGSVFGLGVPGGLSHEQIAQLAKVGVDEVQDLLAQAQHRMRTLLSAQERELISDPMPTKAAGFAEALRSAANRRPLVVLMDTYEIVRQTGPWLREIMARCGPRVGWVLAGRLEDAEPGLPGELAEFRREVHPGGRLRVIKLNGFALQEADAYLRGAAPTRTVHPAELSRMYQATNGIPLAVRAAAARWRDGESMSAITADQPVSGDRAPLAHLLTARFLTHTEQDGDPHGDRPRLLALALISTPEDLELIGALWDVPDAEPVLRELAARHDFVFTGTMRLHDVVRDQFRSFLRDPGNRSGQLRSANRRAIELLERRLADRNARLPTLQERVSNDRWTQTVSSLAWHRFWDGFEAGWETVLAVVPATLAYDRQLGAALLEDADQFGSAATERDRAELRALRVAVLAGPQSVAGPDALAALERRPLTDDVQGDQGCATERTAVLRWQKAKWLVERGRINAALQAFQAAARGLPKSAEQLRQALADDLTSFTNGLIWPAGANRVLPSSTGLAAAKLATRLAPQDRQDAWRALSMAEFGHRQYERALEAMNRATELDPNSARNHIDRANLLGWRCDWAGMHAAAVRSVQIDPSDPETHVCLSSALLSLRRRREALTAARDAVDADRFSANAHIQLANVLLSRRDLDEALSAADEAIRLDPSSAAGQLCRSDVLAALKRHDDALAAARSACDVDPDNPDCHVQLAMALAARRDWTGSRDCADHAIRLNPADPKPYMHRSHALLNLGRYPEALAAAREAVSRGPALPYTHTQLSVVLSWHRDHEAALRSAEQAVERDPTDGNARSQHCDTLIALGRYADAVAAATAMSELDTDDPTGLLAIGGCLLWTTEFRRALGYCRRAANLDPADTRPVLRQAMALTGLRRFDEALDAYRAAVRLDPGDDGLHAWLGIVLQWAGQYDEALAEIEQAIELDPADPSYRQIRGDILAMRSGQPTDAFAGYEQAAELATGPYETPSYEGDAAWLRGQLDQAEQSWLAALRIDPTGNQRIAVRVGVLATLHDDHDQAAGWFRTALSCPHDPWSTWTAFVRAEREAMALSGLGRVDEAVRLLTEHSAARLPGDQHELMALDLLADHPGSAEWAGRIRAAALKSG